MKTKKLAFLALSVALALVLSFVESQIPAFFTVPGVKVGLPNIVIVFLLYCLGWKEAAMVSAIRLVLVNLLFGTGVSFLYALAGAVLSLTGMLILRRFRCFSQITVSILGGVLHNVGQIAMACFVLGTTAIGYYLPVLMLSGIAAGTGVGIIAGILIQRIPADLYQTRS